MLQKESGVYGLCLFAVKVLGKPVEWTKQKTTPTLWYMLRLKGVPDGFYGHLHTEADNKYPPEASTTAMSLTLRSNFLGSNGQKQNV